MEDKVNFWRKDGLVNEVKIIVGLLNGVKIIV
jgi:hypothetical protein